ncbi:hypothetical protein HerbRD11066_15070 [Herbidospora sp. RD11066]
MVAVDPVEVVTGVEPPDPHAASSAPRPIEPTPAIIVRRLTRLPSSWSVMTFTLGSTDEDHVRTAFESTM